MTDAEWPMTAEAVLEAAQLPPLENESDRAAERLVMLVHRAMDWEVWGGARAVRYWDALTARIRAACYGGPTLADWWARITVQMSLTPPRSGDARLLAATLASPAQTDVLRALRTHAEALVLRVRVAVEVRRKDYQSRMADQDASQGDLI